MKISGCLFGDVPRTNHFEVRRTDAQSVFVTIPTNTGIIDYRIAVDERDKRKLFVFDGHIPSAGLPRNASVVRRVPLRVQVPHANVYQAQHLGEEKPRWRLKDGVGTMSMWRIFVLLPSGQCLVRCYHSRNLGPKYLLISRTNERGVSLRYLNRY